MPRCQKCPAPAGEGCPYEPTPHICRLVAREAGYANPLQRHWTNALPAKAAELAASPPPRPFPAGALLFRAHCNGHTGYGLHAVAQGMELEKLGHPVRVECIDEDHNFLPVPGWTTARMVGRTPGRPAFQTTSPFFRFPAGDVAYTMWESTRISPAQAANLNACRGVLVPCEAVRDWFLASGVTPPIRVVPLGIDPAAFRPGARPESRVVRFGCAGRTQHGGVRKGLDEVIGSFLEAFPHDESVRLDVKVWPDCVLHAPTDDDRITVIRDPLSVEGLADWYRSLDVFASASRGEGFGFQPLQAMACGVPTIAPYWGGHASYMTPETGWAVDHREEPAEGPIYGGKGDWCVTSRASMVALMREAHADPDARRAKGAAAATRALDFTWERAGRELEARLIEFGLITPATIAPAPGPLRMAATFAKAVVRHAADGARKASPEVQAERERICGECPNLDPQSKKCNLCGCTFMELKRSWASESCPDAPPRWGAV